MHAPARRSRLDVRLTVSWQSGVGRLHFRVERWWARNLPVIGAGYSAVRGIQVGLESSKELSGRLCFCVWRERGLQVGVGDFIVAVDGATIRGLPFDQVGPVAPTLGSVSGVPSACYVPCWVRSPCSLVYAEVQKTPP